MTRLCYCNGTWQLLSLDASLRTAEAAGIARDLPSVLLVHEPLGQEALARAVWERAESLRAWSAQLDGALLGSLARPKPWEWPALLAGVRRMVGGRRVQELWLPLLVGSAGRILAEAFPSAAIHIYEEGLNNYSFSESFGWRDAPLARRPRLLLRHGIKRALDRLMGPARVLMVGASPCHLQRVERVLLYLAAELPVPPAMASRPLTLVSDDVLLGVLEQATVAWGIRDGSPAVSLEGPPLALLLGQYFHGFGGIPWERELALYLAAARRLITAGFRVGWKEHPRNPRPFLPVLGDYLPAEAFGAVALDTRLPIELAVLEAPPAVCVGYSSSTLYYLPRLFGVRSFTLVGELLAIPGFRKSLGSNQIRMFELTQRHIPSFRELVPAA